MTKIQDLLSYIKGDSRNKIIFSKNPIEGLDYIDVGRELSQLLSISIKKNERDSYDTLCRQIFSQNSFNENIGKYLAIKNLGILFEPELHLNLESIFDSYSTNQTLFINSPGVILDNKFHFFTPHSNFTINLEGLSYKSV